MLAHIISEYSEKELLQHSRIHEIASYFSLPTDSTLWMKREDEIGGGIGGSKMRKYASLIPHILQQQPDYVVIEGGINSNNVLGLASLLRSLFIPFKVATPLGSSADKGNALWTQQITREEDRLIIASTEGNDDAYYQDLLEVPNVYVVKEGAAQMPVIPGLLSLADEIVAFEKRIQLPFDTIFMDAGTGISAVGLLLGLQLLKRQEVRIVITQIAGSPEHFHKLQRTVYREFEQRFEIQVTPNLMKVEFLKPSTSKSFGSFNQTLLLEWKSMMKELGMTVDLVYTAKHFMRVKEYLGQALKPGRFLIINAASQIAGRNHAEKLLPTHPKKV